MNQPEPQPVQQPAQPPDDDMPISKEERDYQHGRPIGESFVVMDKNGRSVFILEG